MNQRLSPVEIICGIDNMQSGGASDVEIIHSLARIAEQSAKNVLMREGFAPDLVTYCYVPDDGLSLEEMRKERLEFESGAWHNEAGHLVGFPDIEIETAALTIIEAGQLSYFLETGQTQKAIISMANLLACGLLHSDQDKDGVIQDRENVIQNKEAAIDILRNKYKNQCSNGGAGKLGYISPIKQYIKTACEFLELSELNIDIAAQRIIKLFKDDNGAGIYESVYQEGDVCPIVAIEYNHNDQVLSYHAIGKPDNEKKLTFIRLKDIVRELRSL